MSRHESSDVICIAACIYYNIIYAYVHIYQHTVDGSEIRLTTWDVKKPVTSGINYHPQLVSRIFSINISGIFRDAQAHGTPWAPYYSLIPLP